METQHPPAVGDSVAASPPAHFTGELAGKWRRFGTFVVDWVLQRVIIFVVSAIVVAALGEQAVEGAKVLLVSIPVFLVYYLVFEGALGQTPGKLALGTRVVTDDGGAPSFRQVIGRTLSRLIPFEPLSVLFAPDGDAVGWHDSLARTKVIRTR